MSDELLRWQADNERFLAAGLRWLRLRLLQLAEGKPKFASTAVSPPKPQSPPANQPDSVFDFAEADDESVGETIAVPQPTQTPRDAVLQAKEEMDKAAQMEPAPALMILAQRFGLSEFEQQLLFLCIAMEMDTRIAALCTQAQQNINQPFPTFALGMALFDDPAWDVMSPERPLRFWRMIEINQPGSQPLTTSSLRADERMVNYVKGLNYLDDRLEPLLAPFEAELMMHLPPSQESAAHMVTSYLQRSSSNNAPPVVQLVGSDALSKQLVAQRAAILLDFQLYRLPIELLPTQVDDLETMSRLWQRESLLLPIVLFLDAHDADESDKKQLAALTRFLARSNGIFFLSAREIRQDVGTAVTAVEVEKPTATEQQMAWKGLLNGRIDSAAPAQLAGQFNLNTATIQQIAYGVQVGRSPEEPIPTAALWEDAIANTRPRLDLLAQRITAKATWEDIVLPTKETSLLRQIADQVKARSKVYDEWGFREKLSRGLGISVLFAGPSGTGKTMAAEVIANHLNLSLYRIDLSAVVSKYIGETEKNLRRLFDAAENGGAILFFDEADALFGKRSEVKDSHDRYANIEINYLLQRMESYQGLAILATNMRSALDQAFLRRLRFIITFPFPSKSERVKIWELAFPSSTPTEGLDYQRLGRLGVTGGSIINIALNAAFIAAQKDEPVRMQAVLTAARTEFRKMNLPIKESDFQWQASPLVVEMAAGING
ncbi:MAG: ATP-binding protein [Chloroflexi bacterium]|nr:ATP-binding protein [Chloroflexota bacterium]